MLTFFFWVWMGSPCNPAKLILRNGTTIWVDCGWQQTGNTVLLKFREFQFQIQNDQVDWRRTKKAVPTLGKPSKQIPKKGRSDWDLFVKQAKPNQEGKALKLTNETLKDPPVSRPRKQNFKSQIQRPTDHIQKLKQTLADLRHRRRQLQAQLKAEVTWRQAQYLLEKIDFLEQQIREKQYWLSRRTQEQRKATKPKSNHTTSQFRKSELGVSGGLKRMEKCEYCATLIMCYTGNFHGDNYGQLNHYHRGSRA